tara:strand:- start:690 stop:842 length:153 start_codon:yes stop_codon:yes gene_type:complete
MQEEYKCQMCKLKHHAEDTMLLSEWELGLSGKECYYVCKDCYYKDEEYEY